MTELEQQLEAAFAEPILEPIQPTPSLGLPVDRERPLILVRATVKHGGLNLGDVVRVDPALPYIAAGLASKRLVPVNASPLFDEAGQEIGVSIPAESVEAAQPADTAAETAPE